MREGGGRGEDCLKYLKRDRTEKRGWKTKIVKRGRGLGQGVGALKRGGVQVAGTPLQVMGDDGYQSFLVFASMLNSLTLYNNIEVTIHFILILA